MGTFGADANGEATSGMNHEGDSTNAAPRGGTPRSSGEVGESRGREGVCAVRRHQMGQPVRGEDESGLLQGCQSARVSPEREVRLSGVHVSAWKAYGRKGKGFCSFSPAMSKKAEQKIRDEIRGWKLHRCTEQSIQELARKINPKLRGWFNYYGRFTPSALRPIERHVGQSLVRWACRKYKKLRNHRSRAWAWLMAVIDRQPNLLALWEHQRSRFVTIGVV